PQRLSPTCCTALLANSITSSSSPFLFFLNHPSTTKIYTLSLHDALPICKANRFADDAHRGRVAVLGRVLADEVEDLLLALRQIQDRKSTRLNSSHSQISYAVFCLKKKRLRTLSRWLGTP